MTHNFVNFKLRETQSLVIRSKNLDSSSRAEILIQAKLSFDNGVKMLDTMLGIGNSRICSFSNFILMGELLSLATETSVLIESWDETDRLILVGKSRLSGKTQVTCRMKFCEALAIYHEARAQSYYESASLYMKALDLILSGFEDLELLRTDEEGRIATNYLIINGAVHFWSIIKSKLLKLYARSYVQQFRQMISCLDSVALVIPQMNSNVTTIEQQFTNTPGASQQSNSLLLNWCLWRVSIYLGAAYVEFDAGDAAKSSLLCDKGLKIVNDLNTDFITPLKAMSDSKSPSPSLQSIVSKLIEVRSSLLLMKVYSIKDKPPADAKKLMDSWNCTGDDMIWVKLLQLRLSNTCSNWFSLWNDAAVSSCPSLFTLTRLASCCKSDVPDSDIRSLVIECFPASERLAIGQLMDGNGSYFNTSCSLFTSKCICQLIWISLYCRKIDLLNRLLSFASRSFFDASSLLWMQVVRSYLMIEETESVDVLVIDGKKALACDVCLSLCSSRLAIADKLASSISCNMIAASNLALQEACVCLWNVIYPIMHYKRKFEVYTHLKTIIRTLDRLSSSPLNELRIQVHVVLSEIELDLNNVKVALREANYGLTHCDCFPNKQAKQDCDFSIDNCLIYMVRICKLKEDVSLGQNVTKFELLEVRLEFLLFKKSANTSAKTIREMDQKVVMLMREFASLMMSASDNIQVNPTTDLMEYFIKNHPGILFSSESHQIKGILTELLGENPRKINDSSYAMNNSETKRKHRKFLVGLCCLLFRHNILIDTACRQLVCALFHPLNCDSSIASTRDQLVAVIFLARSCINRSDDCGLFVQCIDYCLRLCKKVPEMSFALDYCSRLVIHCRTTYANNESFMAIWKKLIVDLTDSESYAACFVVKKDLQDKLSRNMRDGRFGVTNSSHLVQFISSFVAESVACGFKIDDGFSANILKKISFLPSRELYPLLKAVSGINLAVSQNMAVLLGQELIANHPLAIPTCLTCLLISRLPNLAPSESKTLCDSFTLMICDEFGKLATGIDCIGDALLARRDTLLSRDLDDIAFRCWLLTRAAYAQLVVCRNNRKATELAMKCLKFIPKQLFSQCQTSFISWIICSLITAQSLMSIAKDELSGVDNDNVRGAILMQAINRLEVTSSLISQIQDSGTRIKFASLFVDMVFQLLQVDVYIKSKIALSIEAILINTKKETMTDIEVNKKMAVLYSIVIEAYWDSGNVVMARKILTQATRMIPRSVHAIFWEISLSMNELPDSMVENASESSIEKLLNIARNVPSSSVQKHVYTLAIGIAKSNPSLCNMIQLHKSETYHRNGADFRIIDKIVVNMNQNVNLTSETNQAVLVSHLTCSIAIMLMSKNLKDSETSMNYCFEVIERIITVLVDTANRNAALKVLPIAEKLSLSSEEDFVRSFIKYNLPSDKTKWSSYVLSNEELLNELSNLHHTLRERFFADVIVNADCVLTYLKRLLDFCILEGFDDNCTLISLIAHMLSSYSKTSTTSSDEWRKLPNYLEVGVEFEDDCHKSLPKWTFSIIQKTSQMNSVQLIDKSVNLLLDCLNALSSKKNDSLFVLLQYNRLFHQLVVSIDLLCENCLVFHTWRSNPFYLKELYDPLSKLVSLIRSDFATSKTCLMFVKGLLAMVYCLGNIRRLTLPCLPVELQFLDQFESWLAETIVEFSHDTGGNSLRNHTISTYILSVASILLSRSIRDKENNSHLIDSFFAIQNSSNPVDKWLNETGVIVKCEKECVSARKVQSLAGLVESADESWKKSLISCSQAIIDSSKGGMQGLEEKEDEDQLCTSFRVNLLGHRLDLAILSCYLLVEKKQLCEWLLVYQSLQMSLWLKAVSRTCFSKNFDSIKSINFTKQMEDWSIVSYPELLPWLLNNLSDPQASLALIPSNVTLLCLCASPDWSSIFLGVANNLSLSDKNFMDRIRLDDGMKARLFECLEKMDTVRLADQDELFTSVVNELNDITKCLIGPDSKLIGLLSTMSSNHFVLLVDPLLMMLPWESVGVFQTVQSLTRDFSFVTLVERLATQASRETAIDPASKKPIVAKKVDLVAVIDPFCEDNLESEIMALKRLSKSSLTDRIRQTSVEQARSLVSQHLSVEEAKQVHIMSGTSSCEVFPMDVIRCISSYNDSSLLFDGPARFTCFLPNSQTALCNLKSVRCMMILDKKNNHASFIRQSKNDNSFVSEFCKNMESSYMTTAAIATLAGCRGVVLPFMESNFESSQQLEELVMTGLIRDKTTIGKWSKQVRDKLVVFGLPGLVVF